MHHDLLHKATRQLATIHAHHHPGPCIWIVALSGGCDSRVVLELCLDHARSHAVTLITAHVNHKLRASAARDAEFCAELTRRSPLIAHHHTIEVDLGAHHGSIQEAARHARWTQLVELAVRHDACAILTGHHLDDGIETLLMHAARGSGSRGLSSLSASRVSPPTPHAELPAHVAVHRPLISCTRDEIESFARARGIQWIEDPTNLTDAYTRNRIRHHAMPHLVAEQGGHIGWRRTLEILREESDFIDAQLDALWHSSVLEDDPWPDALSVDRDAIRQAHPLLATRLLLRAHARLACASRPPGATHIEAFQAMRADAAPGHIAMSGVRVESEPRALIFLHAPERGARGWFDEAQEPVMIARDASGEVQWAGGVMRWKITDEAPGDDEDLWCRVDVRDSPDVVLRGVRPGDRIAGRPAREVLRELGVPVWRRHLWPCLARDADLLAIQGWQHEESEPEVADTSRWLVVWRVQK